MIFAKIMQDKKGFQGLWKRAFHKYRFVIMTDDSFEEKLLIKLSRINVVLLLSIIFIFCLFSAVLFMTQTPLKEYLPGKAKSEVRQDLIRLTIKADSLVQTLEYQKKYLKNINNIIAGKKISETDIDISSNNFDEAHSFKKSKEDSLLRLVVESEDKGSLKNTVKINTDIIMFYLPVKGLITDRYNSKTRHYAVDIVAKEKTRISSTLEGVVIISNWTYETGYVIGVQHKSGYISLYKHNSSLLKSVGDFVDTGEHIAIIGNSGELSTGPHLHFELWHDGMPVDPENYILF